MIFEQQVAKLIDHIPSAAVPWLRGDTRFARFIRPIINRALPDRAMPVVVLSGQAKGIHMLIKPRAEKFYWTGLHEEHTQKAIADILKSGMSYWDVGTHIGFFALLAGRIVGQTGHVHAFEPVPENLERLRSAISLNNFENITVHETAITASGGTILLRSHEFSTSWSLMEQRGHPEGITVSCETLDSLAQSLPLPDLIKIDVEGAEVDVLRGGIEILTNNCLLLFVEFHDRAALAEAQRLLPFYKFKLIADMPYPDSSQRSMWLLSKERFADKLETE